MEEDPDCERHRGKAALIVDGDKVFLKSECDHCGAFDIGPIPLYHLATMAQLLMDTAQNMGIPVGNTTEAKVMKGGPDDGVIAQGLKHYEQMGLTPEDNKNEDDPWGK